MSEVLKQPAAEAIFNFEHELLRIRKAAHGLVTVIDEVTNLVSRANVIHIGNGGGTLLQCRSVPCSREFIERRAETTPTHGYCTEECYENATGKPIQR